MQRRGTDDIIEVKVTAQEKNLAKECRISLLQVPLLSPEFKIFSSTAEFSYLYTSLL